MNNHSICVFHLQTLVLVLESFFFVCTDMYTHTRPLNIGLLAKDITILCTSETLVNYCKYEAVHYQQIFYYWKD